MAPRISVRETLVRRVALCSLISNTPPDFLYTSGKSGRYNPAGVLCVYFSEAEDTVRLEYERLWAGTIGSKQPFVTYFARIKLDNVLDLSSNATAKALKLRPQDLRKEWRNATSLTETQKLGLVVATRTPISAVRFPSDPAASAGKPGSNLVIFRQKVRRPDYVKILGPDKAPLQTWP